MATQVQHIGGICQNCVHAFTCTYPEGASECRTECEEFSAQGRPVASAPNRDWRPSAKADCDEKLLGLCSNCQLRASCVLHKPESGVWFCEEYR